MRDDSQFTDLQLRAILKTLPEPVFLITRSGRYMATFGGADTRYYRDPSALVGQSISDVLVADKAAWFHEQIGAALAGNGLHVVEYSLAPCDFVGMQDDGQARSWYEGRLQALDFPLNGEGAVLWVASDITARTELELQLRVHGEVDALSGLLNRRKLLQVLAEHFETFTRYGTPTALLIFDIDHFKRVNDNHGHMAGDQVIAATAEVCRRELRTTDAPARLGGDEFVVLMPHTSLDHAHAIAERLRQRIADALRTLGTAGTGATVSGGLAQLAAGDLSGEDALKRADEALYRAKREGRNRIVR